MGMFDSLLLEGQKCARCGAELDKEWQTKSMFNMLRVFRSKEEVKQIADLAFDSYVEFYNTCPKCYRHNLLIYDRKWKPIVYDKEWEKITRETLEQTKKRNEESFLKAEREINEKIAKKQFEERNYREWRKGYADKF